MCVCPRVAVRKPMVTVLVSMWLQGLNSGCLLHIELCTESSHTSTIAFSKCLYTLSLRTPLTLVTRLILNYSPGWMSSCSRCFQQLQVSTACHSLLEFRTQVSHVTSVYFPTYSIIWFHIPLFLSQLLQFLFLLLCFSLYYSHVPRNHF